MANIFTRGFGIRRSNLALHVKVLIRGQLCLYDPEHWAVLSHTQTPRVLRLLRAQFQVKVLQNI